MRIALLPALLLAGPLLAQDLATPQLPPSEQLKAAAQPLAAARVQPDDFTPADMYAYRVGVSRAGHACLDLQSSIEALAKQPEELIAYTHLCLFGLRYEPARQSALTYLRIQPAPPERKQAILLLAQAYLGLKQTVEAAGQILAAEGDYAYDAEIHAAADEVILAGALADDQANAGVLSLCSDQLQNTLPLLEDGKGLSGKDASATPGTLFADAVRCLEIQRDLHADAAQTTLTRLEHIAALPGWQRTAQLEPMQSALARAEMVGKPVPTRAISGKLLHAAQPLRSVTIDLAHGTALLAPFTVWAPSTTSIVADLHVTEPQQPIYLLTSWTANTGDADEETQETLDTLRKTAATLPARVSILIVPDAVMQQFNADAFPAAIVVRDGTVRANLPLTGDAGKRLTVFALGAIPDAPRSQRAVRKAPAATSGTAAQ
jgi:hypothetical protein